MSEKKKVKRVFKEFIVTNDETPSNSYWKEVLDQIYKRVPGAYGPGKFEDEKKNPIAKELKISDWELYKNVMYLTELGLVDIRNEGNYTNMYPTSKGLDIALQNEKIKSDMKIKIGTISFTAILALTAMFTFLLTSGEFDSKAEREFIILGYTMGLTLIYLMQLWKEAKSIIKKKLFRWL